MFFAIHDKEIREVALENLGEHDICVGYLTLDELRKCYRELGLSEIAVKDCMTDFTHFRTSIDVYDEFSFGMINIVDILNLSSRRNRIGFFIKKNLFIVVKIIDKGDGIRQMFLDAIGRFRQNATMEKVVYGVLERLLSSGNKGLVMTERQIIAMEREVLRPLFERADFVLDTSLLSPAQNKERICSLFLQEEKEGMVHMAGMLFLLALMVLILFNDLRKLF